MDYSNKTIIQLKALCKERKIKGYSKKNKNGLIELLMKNDNAPVLESKNNAKTDVKVESQLRTCKYIIDMVFEYVLANNNKDIILLRSKEVIMWLFGDLSFLPSIEKKNKTTDKSKYKILEDKWGQNILKSRRPDLKLDKQWTNMFGQHLCEEIYILLGKKVSKPEKKENYQPDHEVNDAILEVKTQTFYTDGTAGEKILGCPFKYAMIPRLYGKPLKIICFGGAERICREQYGNLYGSQCIDEKKEFLEFYKQKGIEYIGVTDILKAFVNLQ